MLFITDILKDFAIFRISQKQLGGEVLKKGVLFCQLMSTRFPCSRRTAQNVGIVILCHRPVFIIKEQV